ncbi:MAG: tripartite tricarboxylate transporter substrate binding protein [Betaproteobacteria bacterium]|nr:tripartite tricarboxylate transporter substrate binding protein [Betaproteobacteria bacterium]
MLYLSVNKYSLLLAAVCTATLLVSSPARAADAGDWPTRPIRLIVPFAPGGANDVISRLLANKLGPVLGQQVIVDNRGGGGGVIGANLVATASPDGNTLMFNSYSLATGAAARKTPYDPVKDFAAIGRVAFAPLAIVTRTNFPARSVKELVAYAKANPGKISYGAAGPGSSQHLVTELFGLTAGIKMEAIHYKGTGPSLIDLIAGRIDLGITTPTSLSGVGGADKLPKLAFASAQRLASAPDVPTVREGGIDFVAEVWWGVFAPRGISNNIRTRLNAEINKIVAEPTFVNLLGAIGATPSPSTPQEMQDILVKDVQRWTATAEKAGVRQQ